MLRIRESIYDVEPGIVLKERTHGGSQINERLRLTTRLREDRFVVLEAYDRHDPLPCSRIQDKGEPL
jgi:hypothetical protein